MDPLTDLLSYADKLEDCSGAVHFGTDPFYPASVSKPEQEYGYFAAVVVRGARITARGLTPDEAISNLKTKLLKKYGPKT